MQFIPFLNDCVDCSVLSVLKLCSFKENLLLRVSGYLFKLIELNLLLGSLKSFKQNHPQFMALVEHIYTK